MKIGTDKKNILEAKSIQLEFITKRCDQGAQITNAQIRSMLSTLACSFSQFISVLETEQSPTLTPVPQQNGQKDTEGNSKIQEQFDTIRQIISKKVNALDLKIDKSAEKIKQQTEQFIIILSNQIDDKISHLKKLNLNNIQFIKQIQHSLSRSNLQNKQSFKNFINQDFKPFKQKVSQFREQIYQFIQQIQSGKHYQKLKKKLELYEKQTKKHNKNIQKQAKIIQKEEQEMQQKQEIKIVPKKNYFEDLQMFDDGILAAKWVDPTMLKYNLLKFSKDEIICLNWVNIFGIQDLRAAQQYTVKPTKFQDRVYFGVVDSTLRNKQHLDQQLNWVVYGSNGYSWDGKSKKYSQGKGFKVGQQVTIFIDFDENKVIWKVGRQIRHSCQAPQLGIKKIKWVPAIWMVNKDDKIRIIQ